MKRVYHLDLSEEQIQGAKIALHSDPAHNLDGLQCVRPTRRLCDGRRGPAREGAHQRRGLTFGRAECREGRSESYRNFD